MLKYAEINQEKVYTFSNQIQEQVETAYDTMQYILYNKTQRTHLNLRYLSPATEVTPPKHCRIAYIYKPEQLLAPERMWWDSVFWHSEQKKLIVMQLAIIYIFFVSITL